MKFDVKHSIHFLDEELNPNRIPFIDQIDKIYMAYRQCYSKNPWSVPTLTDERKSELKEKWREYCQFLAQEFIEFRNKTFIVERPQLSCEHQKISAIDHLDEYFDYLYHKFLLHDENLYMFLHKCDFIYRHLAHESPLEHGILTVQIQGCSRNFTHQFVRSRIATHSQQSTRYIAEDPDNMEFITPPSIAKNEEAFAAVKNYLEQLGKLLKTLNKCGITKEDARTYYPHCIPAQIVTSMNFRNWMHTLNERCCSRASFEIRWVANEVRKELMLKVPFIFREAGPKCIKLGYCPEEKGCGRMPSRNTFFNK